MKALRIPVFTLLLLIVGIQSHAPKSPQSVFKYQLNSVLGDMQDKLSDQEVELNEIKNSVGKSSSKAAKLLNKCIKIISYLEEMLEASPTSSTTCPVPGAKLSPTRGLCYLLVTDPELDYNDADNYCYALGGYLIEPLPLDTKLGSDLEVLFPDLKDLAGTELWVHSNIMASEDKYMYQNGFVLDETLYSSGEHLFMTLPLTPTLVITEKVYESVETDPEHPFICQFNSTTVFPPFKSGHIYDEDDTNIPDRKYLVDVESVNEVHHHSGEGGYVPSPGAYSEEMYQGEGANPGDMNGGGAGGDGGAGGVIISRKQNPKIIS